METKVIEIWKDITGYEGYYQVSSLGNVRSLNYHKTGRVQNLKIQYCDKKRSSYVILFRDGVCAIKEINRLVYEAFIQEVDMNYDIIHIDGDYKNNILSNLKRSNKKCSLRNHAILCFDKKTMKIVGVYNSQREATGKKMGRPASYRKSDDTMREQYKKEISLLKQGISLRNIHAITSTSISTIRKLYKFAQ